MMLARDAKTQDQTRTKIIETRNLFSRAKQNSNKKSHTQSCPWVALRLKPE
jgi:hypothetical protein